MTDAPNEQAVLNPKQAAARLDLSVRTIYELLRTGELQGRKFGGSWRIPASALDLDADEDRRTTGEAA